MAEGEEGLYVALGKVLVVLVLMQVVLLKPLFALSMDTASALLTGQVELSVVPALEGAEHQILGLAMVVAVVVVVVAVEVVVVEMVEDLEAQHLLQFKLPPAPTVIPGLAMEVGDLVVEEVDVVVGHQAAALSLVVVEVVEVVVMEVEEVVVEVDVGERKGMPLIN